MLIDTHAHLTDKRFDPDRAQVIERARASGVSKIIEVACEPHYWQKALDLAAGFGFQQRPANEFLPRAEQLGHRRLCPGRGAAAVPGGVVVEMDG